MRTLDLAGPELLTNPHFTSAAPNAVGISAAYPYLDAGDDKFTAMPPRSHAWVASPPIQATWRR